MRLLGIDAGEKRIGISVSDRLNKTASPLTVISNDEHLSSNLLKIIEKFKVKKIIVGIPYNLKGEKGYQAERVEDFIENILCNAIKDRDIEVIRLDERFTSRISQNIISKKAGRESSSDIDSISAAILLNDYIEREKTVEKK